MELAPSAHVDTFTRDNLPSPDRMPPFTSLDELGYPQRLNAAAELLDRMVEAQGPDRRCLVAPGAEPDADPVEWSYGDVLRRANQIAGYLTSQVGVVPGNRVLLRAPNNPWLAASWFGVVKAGAVAVTTMPLLRAGELRTIHEIAQINHSLTDFRFVDDLASAGIGGYTVFGSGGPDSLEERIAGQPEDFSNVNTSADDVALLAFTSGTTGRPKASMHFHRDVLAIADTFSAHVLRPHAGRRLRRHPAARLHLRTRRRWSSSRMRRSRHAAAGEGARRSSCCPRSSEHRVTVLFTAPTAYRAMLAASSPAHDVSSLRRCVSAGENLPAATWQAWHDATGLRIINGIGATEMLHIFISAADDDDPAGCHRAVRCPGTRRRASTTTAQPVPDGEPGLLAVRGPAGCRYLADERQSVYVQRRLEPHRRHLHPRRRRLLLLSGARRRHDHFGGLQHRRSRGRGGAAASSRRARVRRRRRPRRRSAP